MKFPVKLSAFEWLQFLSDAQDRGDIEGLKYHLDMKNKELVIDFVSTTPVEFITFEVKSTDEVYSDVLNKMGFKNENSDTD